MSTYEAVCFDLDGTLGVRERDVAAIHEAAFERAGVEPFFEPSDMELVAHEQLPPVVSDVERWTAIVRQLADRLGVDSTPVESVASAIVTEIREDPTFHERETALDVVRAAGESYQTALVTNGSPPTQRRKLERLGVTDAFDAAVYCGPATDVPHKPSPVPFEQVLSELRVQPAAAVHIGNSLRSDVAGARAAGVDAVWLPTASDERPADAPEPDYQLDSPAELDTVLPELGL